MISLIPSLQAPGVRVAESVAPVVTGVPTIEIVIPTIVSTLVYHVSATPVALGSENRAPVAVCSSAQNGSVPFAINGVNGALAGMGITTPVATDIGGVTMGAHWNGFLQLVRSTREMIAMRERDFCIVEKVNIYQPGNYTQSRERCKYLDMGTSAIFRIIQKQEVPILHQMTSSQISMQPGRVWSWYIRVRGQMRSDTSRYVWLLWWRRGFWDWVIRDWETIWEHHEQSTYRRYCLIWSHIRGSDILHDRWPHLRSSWTWRVLETQ